MFWRLIAMGWSAYGPALLRGKVAAAFLLLAAPLWAGPVTVVALGDSLTQGYGLPREEGFVPRLQGWLDDRGVEAKIVNAGVSGDTTAGGAARVDWSLTDEVDAMIVALGGNDMLRGIDPAVSRANLREILQAGRDHGVAMLLVGMEAPGNYGADYKAAFDAMYPELADRFGTLYHENFFKGLPTDEPRAMQAFFQPDGIHPNARGVARIVAAMGPKVRALIERARAPE
ncbi:arylesterase [Roseovarius salinarum]|uniref:arylesterase n=1 Tax=Roseovarius salinarum TaxID=1981892 RepID=UPI000C33F478|nr:arylesterase [Roseovarius salinarum]